MYTTMLTAQSLINTHKYYNVFVRIDRKTGIAEIDKKAHNSLKRNLIKWKFDRCELEALSIRRIEYV